MAAVIGITGGMASGKSTVCRVFEALGVPVFYADEQAKSLYSTHTEVIAAVRELLGSEVWVNGAIDRATVSRIVFRNQHLLEKLNAIVHPVVGQLFEIWLHAQSEVPYVIREAAIMIETGTYKDCARVVLVSAPLELRIERAMARHGLNREQVLGRLARQWTDEQKRPYCQHELVNDDSELLTPQILRLHQHFLQLTGPSE